MTIIHDVDCGDDGENCECGSDEEFESIPCPCPVCRSNYMENGLVLYNNVLYITVKCVQPQCGWWALADGIPGKDVIIMAG